MSAFTRAPERRDLAFEDVWGSPLDPGRGGATAIPAVYGSVRLIGDEWAQAPTMVTQRSGHEYEPIDTPLILDDPDPFMSEFDWKFTLVASLKLRGNAFGLVDDGRRYCRWLPHEWVSVDESNPLTPRYFVLGRPVGLVKQGGNLIHVREFVQAGRTLGLSPIQHFAATFETSALARSFGRKWFKNSSMPPAILQSKTPRLGGDVLRQARDDFMVAAVEGKPVALPGEWDYTKITITAEESQFLQTIQATANEVAVIFGVPPEKVGGRAGSSRSYSNVEMDQELFEIETLGGVSARTAGALKPVLRTGQRIAYDLSVLKQPNLLDQHKVRTEQLKNGTLTLAEARRDLGRRQLTPEEIEDWQQWFATTKSESQAESIAQSVSTAITKEAS